MLFILRAAAWSRLIITTRLSLNRALTAYFPPSKPLSPLSGCLLNIQTFSTISQPLYQLPPKSLPKRMTPRPASSPCKDLCSPCQNVSTNSKIRAGKGRALMTIGTGASGSKVCRRWRLRLRGVRKSCERGSKNRETRSRKDRDLCIVQGQQLGSVMGLDLHGIAF